MVRRINTTVADTVPDVVGADPPSRFTLHHPQHPEHGAPCPYTAMNHRNRLNTDLQD